MVVGSLPRLEAQGQLALGQPGDCEWLGHTFEEDTYFDLGEIDILGVWKCDWRGNNQANKGR